MIWFFVILIVIGLCLYVPIAGGSNKYYKEQLNNYSLTGNIKIQIGDVTSGSIFILSNNKELFHSIPINKKFNYINIKSILKIELESKYEYKGKQKVVSLTPQANIVGKEIGVALTIVTEDNVYGVFAPMFQKNDAIRLKTILEKEMEEVE